MDRPTNREKVFLEIDKERDYQDSLSTQHTGNPTIEGELLMLQEYINRARTAWTNNFDDNGELPAREVIRKIAGISVRCLENYGCPSRQK
jgi:hypothetical protein